MNEIDKRLQQIVMNHTNNSRGDLAAGLLRAREAARNGAGLLRNAQAWGDFATEAQRAATREHVGRVARMLEEALDDAEREMEKSLGDNHTDQDDSSDTG